MELISLSKFAAALVFVLCLMGGLALILRWIDQKSSGQGWNGLNMLTNAQSRRRMEVVERLTIDRQKTALILRIDDREYLVISGTSGDTVLESKDKDGTVVQFKAEQNRSRSGSADKLSDPRTGKGV